MEKFNKNTKYSIIKQTALAMIITKEKKFTLNDLLVEMADRCAEDVPYDRYKKAITETIDELLKDNLLKEVEGEYVSTLIKDTQSKPIKAKIETSSDIFKSKEQKDYGSLYSKLVEDEYFDR